MLNDHRNLFPDNGGSRFIILWECFKVLVSFLLVGVVCSHICIPLHNSLTKQWTGSSSAGMNSCYFQPVSKCHRL